jgi:hypothetical protein
MNGVRAVRTISVDQIVLSAITLVQKRVKILKVYCFFLPFGASWVKSCLIVRSQNAG